MNNLKLKYYLMTAGLYLAHGIILGGLAVFIVHKLTNYEMQGYLFASAIGMITAMSAITFPAFGILPTFEEFRKQKEGPDSGDRLIVTIDDTEYHVRYVKVGDVDKFYLPDMTLLDVPPEARYNWELDKDGEW